jgi:hypothetical protein
LQRSLSRLRSASVMPGQETVEGASEQMLSPTQSRYSATVTSCWATQIGATLAACAPTIAAADELAAGEFDGVRGAGAGAAARRGGFAERDDLEAEQGAALIGRGVVVAAVAAPGISVAA